VVMPWDTQSDGRLQTGRTIVVKRAESLGWIARKGTSQGPLSARFARPHQTGMTVEKGWKRPS